MSLNANRKNFKDFPGSRLCLWVESILWVMQTSKRVSVEWKQMSWFGQVKLRSFFSFLKILFILKEGGREGDREGEKHWCVRTSVGCLPHVLPDQGPSPQPQACVLTGNWTDDLLLCRTVSKQLSYTGQGTSVFILTETLQQTEIQHSQRTGEIVCQGGIGLVFILPLLWDYVEPGTRSWLTCGLWIFLSKFFLSKIRAHVATCSKYQNYIMEGVKATTKDASLQPRYMTQSLL